jgi:hypothetical protein
MEPYLHKRHYVYFINRTKINTILFAEAQVIIADSEDTLQKAIFILQNMAENLEWKFYQENLRRWCC